MLPIVHSTAEELAMYIWDQLCKRMKDKLSTRRIEMIEVGPPSSSPLPSPSPSPPPPPPPRARPHSVLSNA